MDCTWTEQSFAVMARAVGMLLLPKLASDGLCDTLPSPTQLLDIAATESAWDVWMVGAQHPALACALVWARVGKWADARHVALALLGILKSPLARFEAQRLLARCEKAAGAPEAAEAALKAAESEATAAGYLGLAEKAQMVSLGL